MLFLSFDKRKFRRLCKTEMHFKQKNQINKIRDRRFNQSSVFLRFLRGCNPDFYGFTPYIMFFDANVIFKMLKKSAWIYYNCIFYTKHPKNACIIAFIEIQKTRFVIKHIQITQQNKCFNPFAADIVLIKC